MSFIEKKRERDREGGADSARCADSTNQRGAIVSFARNSGFRITIIMNQDILYHTLLFLSPCICHSLT